MRVLTVGIAVIGISVAGQAAATDNKPQLSDKDRVVCRNQLVTGTRMTKRVCKARTEWEQSGERSRDALQEQMSRPVINRQGEAPNGIGE